MIAVTERAKNELKKILTEKVDNPLAVLRLTPSHKGLGLTLDVEMPGDETLEHENTKILVVERTLVDDLKNVTLDVEDTPEGSELVIIKERAQ
jgi:Fe-S cluster assembly iron-binding protein IscA